MGFGWDDIGRAFDDVADFVGGTYEAIFQPAQVFGEALGLKPEEIEAIESVALGVALPHIGAFLGPTGAAGLPTPTGVAGGDATATTLQLLAPGFFELARLVGLDPGGPLPRMAAGAQGLATGLPGVLDGLWAPMRDILRKEVPEAVKIFDTLRRQQRRRPVTSRWPFDALTAPTEGEDALDFVLADFLEVAGVPGTQKEAPFAISDTVAGWIAALVIAPLRLLRVVLGELGQVASTLAGPLAPAGEELGQLFFDAVGLMHGALETVVARGSGLVFEDTRRRLDRLGQVTPENVGEVAGELVAVAAGLGMAAHSMASLAEFGLPTKELGLNHLAAMLTKMAGFEVMADAFLGVEFDTALRGPSRRRALRRFRPELPGSGEMEQLFLERLISEEEFRDFLAEQGWADRYIDAHVRAVWKEPRPADLAWTFEDVDIEDGWVARMLRESGYDDETADRLMAGLRNRSMRQFRSGVLSAARQGAVTGQLAEPWVEGIIEQLRLRPEAVQLFRTQIALERDRQEDEELARILEDGAAAGQWRDDDLRAELAALGYDERAQEHAVHKAQLRRGVETFREETADVKAAMRRAQSAQVTALLDRHRRFEMDDGELAYLLRGVGVRDEEVDALVERARVRRTPIPRLETVLSPEAQAQRLAETVVDTTLAALNRRAISEATAVAALVALGRDLATAAAEVALVVQRRPRPPAPAKPEPEPAAVRVERETRTDAILARFREGLLDAAQARAQLEAVGQPVGVAAALLEREVAKLEAARVRDAARRQEAEFEAERKTLEQTAIEAFRRGGLTEWELLATLVALGRSRPVAEALVQRESQRLEASAPAPA